MLDDSQSQSKIVTLSFADRLGMFLSALCLLHCVVTPLILLSLPLVIRFYLVHPLFHVFLALFIVPLGVYTFMRGYRLHAHNIVLWLGIPGLMLVGLGPLFLDIVGLQGRETLIVSIGSLLLVVAHWKNHRACRCPVPHLHH